MEDRRKIRRRLRGILLGLLIVSVPMETNWILNGARADEVLALEQDMERFRCFQLEDEPSPDWKHFSEKECRKLTMRYLYGGGRAPLFFQWQLDEEIWKPYYDCFATVLSDIRCFPVALDGTGGETLSFENSWGGARNYGGDRRHEGVDIMTSNNMAGYFPAVSMCDGTIEKMGWLELGGYRIGIRSEHGLYTYYAHLDSYREGLKTGDRVRAGDIIGYLGDTGYGPEGTRGKFDVHLHFGLYVDIDGREVSLNPYWILKQME